MSYAFYTVMRLNFTGLEISFSFPVMPNPTNLQVGEVYNRYMTGDMVHYYSSSGSKTRRASGSQPLYSMALELYVDKLKVILL